MGIFDFFTGDSVSDAAAANQTYVTNTTNAQNQKNYDYTVNAENKLTSGLASAQSQYADQQNSGLAALNSSYSTGVNDINTGASNAQAYLDPYAQAGNAAQSMYTNSLGLNGASGNEAATSAFQASPGYQWQVDQATDAAARNANSLGMAASGNTLAALAQLGSNYANQEYGSWQDRLSGQATMGQQVASEQAGIANSQGQNLASLSTNLGNQSAALYKQGASDLSSLTNTNAIANAALWQNLGTQQSDLTKSSMNNVSSANMQGAQAEMTGSGNLWGAITGLFS